MPKRRPPKEVWASLRHIVWCRDGKKCVRCLIAVTLQKCNIDHVISGKLGTNKISNLRTLCRRCHTLRADHRHHGMIASALRDGIIGPDWREHVWDDKDK